jgi:nitroimidazol reductase NimA-like FMN-containing flavoprotein (pyridoxamine 5'-phosphate oxidase superfamily)
MNYPSMRRQDRKLQKNEAIKIIESSEYGVLSLCSNDTPYGVPLNPVLYKDTLYFHCAKQGFKIDIINDNPYGHFVFVSKYKVLKEKFTTLYDSAMVHGSLRYVDDPDERMLAYKLLLNRYVDNTEFDKKHVEKCDKSTTLIAMDINDMSAKSNSKE